MRTKKEYVRMSVEKDVHEWLKDKRDEFQNTIGNGKWSLSDAVRKLVGLSRKN